MPYDLYQLMLDLRKAEASLGARIAIKPCKEGLEFVCVKPFSGDVGKLIPYHYKWHELELQRFAATSSTALVDSFIISADIFYKGIAKEASGMTTVKEHNDNPGSS